MIHLAIFVLTQAGFLLLMLAMTRHQQEWLRRKLPAARAVLLRRTGFILLALAFTLAGIGFGWGYGTVAWCGWLSAAAAIAVTLNVNRERILARLKA